MARNLLIVESPAKAKTIEGYLGSDFMVKSSYGHIRDLAKGNDAIDIEHNYDQVYEVPDDKKAIVAELKKLSKQAEVVWLASDEDREGEAISWHLLETLGLKPEKTRRIVFHEITKPAILKAIANPRTINFDLVHAQQARRVLDRLVGFELSPVLWRKVKPSLSAGRVQSVAVRLVVDREREINQFAPVASFRVVAQFNSRPGELKTSRNVFKAEFAGKINTEEQAQALLTDCIGASYSVSKLETRPLKRSPAAPFTTSTLQQEASRKLGFSVSRTMSIAQKLYENGKITYMRTDSVNLSDTALEAAQKEITSAYGGKYHHSRKYKTKTSGAQEAHEAIRPTYFSDHTTDGDNNEMRLYELIWKRAIASQMSEAQIEKTIADISVLPAAGKSGSIAAASRFRAEGEVIRFDGFLKVYMESSDEELESGEGAASESDMLPPLTEGQNLEFVDMLATERYSRAPARYTEASLVKKLEELGIGRPSTYAPTISTVQKRGYVVKEDREGKERLYRILELRNDSITKRQGKEITGAERSKLFPTDIGMLVNDFLVQHFNGIVDFHFTAKVEKQFDEIAQGLQEWTEMINSFYRPFHSEVEKTIETAERQNGARDLGVDPETGKRLSVRIGRYGPFVQIGETPTGEEDEKPRYASLRSGQLIETISLEEALALFHFPKKIGFFEDQEMTVAIGRFGPYIKHKNQFYSLFKADDPLVVTEDRGITIIEEKRVRDVEKTIKVFEQNPEVKILKGRWGPFIAYGKLNIKIPKGHTPESVTYEDCVKLAAEMPPEKGKGKSGAKTKLVKLGDAVNGVKSAENGVKVVIAKKAATKKAATKKAAKIKPGTRASAVKPKAVTKAKLGGDTSKA